MGCGGSKRRVTGVTCVAGEVNQLNLLDFIDVTQRSSFTSVGCYKPDRCYSSVWANRRPRPAEAV